MRARYPDREGVLAERGVHLHYELYENEGPTVVLVPTWCMFHSRLWKMQIPYLARHYRLVTWDPRGNGRSSRPRGREHHGWRQYLGDLVGILDVTDTPQAVLVGTSQSGYWANLASVLHPGRVLGVVAIAPGSGLGILPERRPEWHSYTEVLDTTEGWAKENVHYIRRDYRGYVEFFVSQMFLEPHSTKQIEDGVGWAMETDAETLIESDLADVLVEKDMAAFYRRTVLPLLIIQGEDDPIVAPASSRLLARLTGAALVTLDGSSHAPTLRDPVRVNLLIKEFVDRVAGRDGVAA